MIIAVRAISGGHPGIAVVSAGGLSGMDMITSLQAPFGTLLAPFFDIIDSRNLFSFVGAFIFLFLTVFVVRLRRPRKDFRFRALLRLVFRRSHWLHPSAVLDYKVYAINMVLLAFIIGFFVVSAAFFSGIFGALLASVFGPAPTSLASGGIVVAVVVASQLLALDFAYWLCHMALHKNAILWEFHKAHHSATALTPATEYRLHPVEMIIVPCTMAVTMGLASAVTRQIWGADIRNVGQFEMNLIVLVHVFTIHHLRHTPFNIPFTGPWAWLIHSPAHHRLHHSDDPAHFDRNFGFMLSIWDGLAGTLCRPVPNQRIALGIGAETARYHDLSSIYWLPVRNAWAIVRDRLAGLRRRPSHPQAR